MIVSTGFALTGEIPLSGSSPAEIEQQAEQAGCYAYAIWDEIILKVGGDWVAVPGIKKTAKSQSQRRRL